MVVGVRGTELAELEGVTGFVVCWNEGNDFTECTRLDGETISTTGLRFRGVTAAVLDGASARGSGLSSGGRFFEGGVVGRAGAGKGGIA